MKDSSISGLRTCCRGFSRGCIVELKAGLGLSRGCDGEVVAGDEAVATVACDLVAAGTFCTIAIAGGAGEVEKRCALHFEDCFKARTAFLAAGVDRSILEGRGKSGEEREGEARTKGEMP